MILFVTLKICLKKKKVNNLKISSFQLVVYLYRLYVVQMGYYSLLYPLTLFVLFVGSFYAIVLKKSFHF